MKLLSAALGVNIWWAGMLSAQVAFEAADVHVSPPNTPKSVQYMPGRVEKRGVTMLELITDAWAVDAAKVVGGPSWLNTDKYDVTAIWHANSSTAVNVPAMSRKLLADRFQLVVRDDKRDRPVYVLTVGKKETKLQPAAAGNSPRQIFRGTGDPALENHTICQSCTMADLAGWLPQGAPRFVKRPVVDETGLQGAFDFQLDWMSWEPYNLAKANPSGPVAVGLFDAVENLGLKLDPGVRSFPVLVVDRVNETPSPNPAGVTVLPLTYPTEFETAQVRPAKSAAFGAMGPVGQLRFGADTLEIMSATMKGLITFAFDCTSDQVVGAPKWMEADRFDVIAKAPTMAPVNALKVMLKNLLAQRFHLETHAGEQPMPVFVLLAGKNPKLKESDGTVRSACRFTNNANRNVYTCRNTSMAQLAERLPGVANLYIHPPLLDLTELKGAYDFELSWTPRTMLPVSPGEDAATTAPVPANGLTLFEALDRQLGLKSEEQKRPMPALVIDSARQIPSER